MVDDDRKFHAISTVVLTDLIFGFFLTVLGASVVFLISIELMPIPYWVYIEFLIIGASLFLYGVSAVWTGLEGRRKYIKPYIDWEKFHDTTFNRIKSLSGAGLDEGELAKFIDEMVALADKEIPQLEEDEIEDCEAL